MSRRIRPRGSLPLVLSLLIPGSGCVAFMEQAPCQDDGNCKAGQRCDLDTHTCVAASLSDAGAEGEDGGGEDGALPDVLGVDLAGTDGARPDSASPDSARPDAAQPDRFVPCVDNDGDDYGSGCAAGFDCDDGDPTIFPGSFCDDGVATTVGDVCLPSGSCQGFYRPGAGACAMSCAGCAGETCCIEDCGPQGCPDCQGGCVCAFSFDRNQSATATCTTSSTCHLWVQGGGDADLVCDGASCYLFCDGNTGSCSLDCQNGAYCVLRCSGAESSCQMTGCTAGAMTCPDGVVVCDRVCPSGL